MASRDIQSFNLIPGRTLARKYEIVSRLGGGWEGEVYRIREKRTGIERAAKLFFPHRNVRNKAAKFYARKLHKLRDCPIVIHYHTEETVLIRRIPITVLVSEYVEGELLTDFLARQPGGRLHPFQGLHLLHALIKGIECIHRLREYHGDLHPGNVIVERYGLSFYLKILDEPYSALNEPPCHERRVLKRTGLPRFLPPSLEGAVRLAPEIRHLRHRRLHAEGHLVLRDPRERLRASNLLVLDLIQLRESIEHPSPDLAGHTIGIAQVENRVGAGAKTNPRVLRGEETGTP